MAAGPSCRQSAERQEYPKSARKPVPLLGNLTRSRRRLQPQSLKTKTLSVDTMTRRRKWPISCHFVPFSAISGHFVKKIYTSPDNLFCFHHFARPWPLTSRRAALPSIQEPDSADFCTTNQRNSVRNGASEQRVQTEQRLNGSTAQRLNGSTDKHKYAERLV